MDKPIKCHVNDVHATKEGRRADRRVTITLDGVRLTSCFDLNEAEGWADVWVLNEWGNPIAPLTSERKHGVVRLEASPEVRAWYEEHFAV